MPSISLAALGGLCSTAFVASWSLANSRSREQAAAPRMVKTKRGIPNKSPNLSNEVENPCKTCAGRGRCNCWTCDGRGRINYLDENVLPKGVFPMWCSTCRGGGLVYCDRCMGTGVQRDPIGFRI